MRKRRIDAKTRVIARECLSGLRGPAETCEALSRRSSLDRELLSDEDWRTIEEVADVSANLPTGARRDLWHLDFREAKLSVLADLEASVHAEVEAICGRLLQVMEQRRLEKESQ